MQVHTLFVCILLISTLGNPNFIVQKKTIIYPTGISENVDWMNSTYMPLEKAISRRLSIKDNYYSQTDVPWELILKVLGGSYGYSALGRTVPSLSGNYPLIIYVCNNTTAYRFIPETNSLSPWKEGDYRELGGGYQAPIQLYIVLDTNVCKDVRWGNAEAGCVVQNINLMANTLNLGTVCQGGTWLNRTLIQHGLGLQENEKVLYKMPLGFPLPPFYEYKNLITASRPSSPQLPEIQDSDKNLEDALNLISSSHKWSERPVTLQELSQVLWASYGYSYYEDISGIRQIERHRTVPSAGGIYPIRIYMVNSSGVYKYLPYEHTITMIKKGDVRLNITSVSGNIWASSAPVIIVILWDDSHILTIDTTYCEVGLVTQNIFLESTAWGLIVDWGKADTNEEEIRTALGLMDQTELHPASIVTLGHITESLPIIGTPNQWPSKEIVDPGQNVTVSVPIIDAESRIQNVTLHYSLNNSTTWEHLHMYYNSTLAQYQAIIPGQSEGTWVKYNVSAYDKDGNYIMQQSFRQYFVPKRDLTVQFKIENLVVSSAEVKLGEMVNIIVTIINIGEISGKYIAKLKINDIIEDSKEVILDAGNSTNVTFQVIKNTEGSYNVEIGERKGTFIVTSPTTTPSYLIYIGIVALIIFIAVITWVILRH